MEIIKTGIKFLHFFGLNVAEHVLKHLALKVIFYNFFDLLFAPFPYKITSIMTIKVMNKGIIPTK
jgi:hypothetical protein